VHEPGDGVLTGFMPLFHQILVDARAAVDAVAFPVTLFNGGNQLLPPLVAGALGPMKPGLIAGTGDGQDIAQQFHGILRLVVTDEGEPQGWFFAK